VVQGGTIKSQVSLVNLFATVRDKNKRIVPNLKQEDFRIRRIIRTRKSHFSRKKWRCLSPSLAARHLRQRAGHAQRHPRRGSQFISRIIRKGDEALVMSFDSNVDLLSDFNGREKPVGTGHS